jgi:hypothetical protein
MFAALVEDILIAVASVLVVGSASAQTPVNCDGQRTQFGANGSMSYLGQFQKSARANAMSAFPPLATRQRTSLEVRFVPEPYLTGRTYSARLKTASSVTSFTNGLVNFNSLSVSEVMLRFSEGLPVRFAKVLA